MNGPATGTTKSERNRGQSSVVGVALLLGATVLALGALTASVGTLVDSQTASADAERVAGDFEDALRPVETTGYRSDTVRFGDGTVRTVERELRVLDSSGVVDTVDVGGLVYERGDHRVAAVAGAVVRSHGDSDWTVDPPPVVGSEATDSLVVGAGKLNASDGAVGGGATLRLETNVSHDRRALGPGQYAVAIETTVPGAFERVFEERGATVTRRDFDRDGVPSVVAAYPGRREAYLVVHDMRLEVNGA